MTTSHAYAVKSDISATSASGKIWQWRAPHMAQVASIAQQTGLTEVCTRILVGRGFMEDDIPTLPELLAPKLEHLPDPSHLIDMDKAAERLCMALKANEHIAVFGDYDVDGACAAAVLIRYFRALGHAITLYIPDRLTEGYGPNAEAMEKLAAQGVNVLITVDTGGLATQALGRAKELGMDVIITDHHQMPGPPPPCVACINPNRADETTNCTMLSGTGVAFYLVLALNRMLRGRGYFTGKITEPNTIKLLDLVAVATIADVVPLVGVNRVLVNKGLQVLNQWQNFGLRALANVAGVREASVYAVGFQIGPRINAGGRIDDCSIGAKMLSTEDWEEAQHFSQRLHLLNQERQAVEKEVLDAAMQQAEELMEKEAPHVLVLYGQGWHAGVIGIVASRIKERFYRPTFVIGVDENGKAKGSGRSIEGVDLGAAVHNCKAILLSGGGHTMAAGISLMQENIAAFTHALNAEIAQKRAKNTDLFTPKYLADAALTPSGITEKLFEDINRLNPYGAAFPEPRFIIPQVYVKYAKTVGGDGSHVKCTLQGLDGKTVNSIAFGAMQNGVGEVLMQTKQRIAVAGKLTANTFNGVTRIELQIEDVHTTPDALF